MTSSPPPLRRLHSWFLLRPKFWIWIAVICAFLLALRIALPCVLEKAINNRLAKVEGYSGGVGGIDLQLFRGAYRIRKVSLQKKDGAHEEPFFSADLVDFSLAWGELFHGRFVSDIYLRAPKLQLTKTETPVDAMEEGKRWQDVINDLFPIDITHLEIEKAELRFVDATSKPRVDITIHDLHAVATGLRNNQTAASGPYPATLAAEGVTIGDGHFKLFVKGAPLAEQPQFDLKLDVQDVQLPALNDFLEAYANVDVSAGTFQLYTEITAADGAFNGYIKPFAENINFKNIEDRTKGPLHWLWERIVSGVTSIVKNEKRDQVATRIPISGKFGKTEIGIWATIVNLVRHGFGHALSEGRDDEPVPTQKREEAAVGEKTDNARSTSSATAPSRPVSGR